MPDLSILGHKTCTICHLRKGCTQVVPGDGADPKQATIAFIGEAPGQVEDETGHPFVGPAGDLIKGIVFDGMGLDLRRVFWSNVYHCRPMPHGRCRPVLIGEATVCKEHDVRAQIALHGANRFYFVPCTSHDTIARQDVPAASLLLGMEEVVAALSHIGDQKLSTPALAVLASSPCIEQEAHQKLRQTIQEAHERCHSLPSLGSGILPHNLFDFDGLISSVQHNHQHQSSQPDKRLLISSCVYCNLNSGTCQLGMRPNNIELAEGSICPTIWLPAELKRMPQLKVIVALGRTALNYFRPGTEHQPMQQLASKDSRWPDQNYGPYWVVGAFHPSAALHAGVVEGEREGNIILVSLVSSIQRALYYMDDVPFYNDEED